jgi:hypothetical protein
MIDNIENYEYLWDDQTGRYVLIQAVLGSQLLDTCVVYDLTSKTGLIIEDDDVAKQVKKRLADKGAPMLSDIP